MELVLLVTPTTPKERMATIATASQGFVYLVSIAGVTGARANVATNVEKLIADLQGALNRIASARHRFPVLLFRTPPTLLPFPPMHCMAHNPKSELTHHPFPLFSRSLSLSLSLSLSHIFPLR